jgi:hypothetical protein
LAWVQLLVVLIITGFEVGVRAAIDDLDHPLGVLELHLLLIVTLMDNLLLACPLVRRHAVAARLLLMEVLCELLDLPTLLGIVALGVVHRAPQTAPRRCWKATMAACHRVGHDPHQPP